MRQTPLTFYRILWISEARDQQNRQLKIEDGRSKIATFNPPFSILHFLVARPTDQWTNTDDAEEQFMNGNILGSSYLAKRVRQKQMKQEPAKARQNEQTD
jgi:hypothetical protein